MQTILEEGIDGPATCSQDQINRAFEASRLALRLALSHRHREHLPTGHADPVMFYDLLEALATLREQELLPPLSKLEGDALAHFVTMVDNLPWQPVPWNPQIKELQIEDMTPLALAARKLLHLIERRSKNNWWQRLFEPSRTGPTRRE